MLAGGCRGWTRRTCRVAFHGLETRGPSRRSLEEAASRKIPDHTRRSSCGRFSRSLEDYPVPPSHGHEFNGSLPGSRASSRNASDDRSRYEGLADGIMRAKRIEEETRFRLLRYTHRAKCRKII